MSTVSAIIPTWNKANLLATVLQDLRAQTRPLDEIIVVDNGSSDETPAVAETFGATLVRFSDNRGFAAAVNEGIRQAKSDWLLIANNDVAFQPEWLEHLVDAAEETNAAFAAGKLFQKAHADRIDGTWDMVSRGAYAWRCGYGRLDGALWRNRRRIWFAPMTAALFHRRAFDIVGLLDTRFEAYYEDVDFGIRCALNGLEGVFEPTAVATHQGKSTLGKNGARVLYLTARNQVFLLAKHYSASTLRRFAWPILVGQLLALVAAGTHGHFFTAFRGKWEGVRQWHEFRDKAAINSLDSGKLIESALSQSEREIRDMQKRIGYDPYWRIYFSLVRSG